MKWIAGIVVVAVAVGLWLGMTPTPADSRTNWSQWRGPDATGVSPDGDPPVEWSEDRNVRWKVAIPGKGHASPIIWEQTVFVATAVPTTGRTRWRGRDRSNRLRS